MQRQKPITLILAATTPALGIGQNGALPWRLKREMKFFRQATLGSAVVMGRKTWDSIPTRFRPLTDRINVVISRDKNASYGGNVIAATSVEDALHKIDRDLPVFVIGGGQIYQSSLAYADRILMTLIEDFDGKFVCDTFFEFDQTEWQRQSVDRLKQVLDPAVEVPPDAKVRESGLGYTFTLWEKAKPEETRN